MSNMKPKIIEVEELTKIHTGDAYRKHVKLRETGILGSLRWWYETIVRGLGGTACDPTDKNKHCPDKEGNHCDACELFGCTGWSRKFRLEVEEHDNTKRLKFYPLRRNIQDIEWGLLNKTFSIIKQHGALGGKIAEGNCGLIKINSSDLEGYSINKSDLDMYLNKKGSSTDNPNLSRFFFVNNPYKKITEIKQLKDKCKFLKGQGPKVAKRYFYKTKNGKLYRYFAYAKDSDEFEKIKAFLDSNKIDYIEGRTVLNLEGD